MRGLQGSKLFAVLTAALRSASKSASQKGVWRPTAVGRPFTLEFAFRSVGKAILDRSRRASLASLSLSSHDCILLGLSSRLAILRSQA